MSPVRVLTVGDAMVDLFLQVHDVSDHCSLDKDEKVFRLAYGEKIPLDEVITSLGGIACNVSVGLQRLGIDAALCAELGNDEFAQKIKRGLENEGVDTSRLTYSSDKPSSLAVGIHFQKERTLFVGHVKRDHAFRFDALATSWVYLAGLGKEWKTPYKDTLAFVKRSGAKLAFAIGSTQLHHNDGIIDEVLQEADVIFLNKEEAETILKQRNKPHDNLETIIDQLLALGSQLVSITDGTNGSFIGTKDKKLSLSIFPADVVEKTGAGDAYACAFLAAILLGKEVEEAMRWGAGNAASVVGKIGAQKGLLTKSKLEEKLEQHKEIEAKALKIQ